MDWTDLATSVLSGVIAGTLSAGAAVYVVRRESSDREQAMALEREKWEFIRAAPLHRAQRRVILDGIRLIERYEVLMAVAEHLDDVTNEYRNIGTLVGELRGVQLSEFADEVDAFFFEYRNPLSWRETYAVDVSHELRQRLRIYILNLGDENPPSRTDRGG